MKRHARTARRLIRTLKKSKYRQAKASRKYKHGWEVPRDYAHALQLDIQKGNNIWKDAMNLEIEQIKEYQIFKDYGKVVYEKDKIGNAPKGHQKIRVHFVFHLKHCGKFKTRLVADGHLTNEPNETVYSGVVSLRNLTLSSWQQELLQIKVTSSGTDRILAFLTFIPFLQYVNWRFPRCLCSGNRGFGNERI